MQAAIKEKLIDGLRSGLCVFRRGSRLAVTQQFLTDSDESLQIGHISWS